MSKMIGSIEDMPEVSRLPLCVYVRARASLLRVCCLGPPLCIPLCIRPSPPARPAPRRTRSPYCVQSCGVARTMRLTWCAPPQLRVVPNTTGQLGTNSQTGAEFKADLHSGKVKFGIFVNSHSTTVAEQMSFSGYDWLLVDTQHGPMEPTLMSTMLAAISNGGAKSMVRVGGAADRDGIQQALDLGANGVLIPYINTAEEAAQGISCALYPTAGTRSVYFPQRAMNEKGLLGYAGAHNDNVVVALQVETASCIQNIDEIAALPGLDMLFLGQNDLSMSMGLYEKYEYPEMYFSPELNAATDKLRAAAARNNIILGLFLFGTDRVGEFIDKGFTFISIGNDLHHMLTQATSHIGALRDIAKEHGKDWEPTKYASGFGISTD